MNEALGQLPTERVDDRYAAIDTASVIDLATLMNEADMAVPAAVHAVLPQIVDAVDVVVDGLARGGRLFYVGAGSAGRLGVLDAAECPPTFNTPPGLVQAVLAGGDGALALAVEGAEDDVRTGARTVADHGITRADVVVGISASGYTPFVVAAVRAAAQVGAPTIGLSCNRMTPLSAAVSHPIEVLVGPEVVAGSTRLKAGTAQKLVLNMISTIAMVRLGKTYGNLMVDLRVTNTKLRQRAVRIFISHDVAMVRHISDRVAVMYLGRIVEQGAWKPVLDAPRHPYTAALCRAVPIPVPGTDQPIISTVTGEVPDPANPPTGCPFHPRCPLAEDVCRTADPPLLELAPAHWAACHVAARSGGITLVR